LLRVEKLSPAFVESDSFSIERELYRQGNSMVAGVDEAGRGPLAGPVVAACVVLPVACNYRQFKDSKTLSPSARVRLFQILKQPEVLIGVGIVSEKDIDRINILQASLLAMRKAVLSLASFPDFLLVDGKFSVPVRMAQYTLVKGETRSASIAAASIVAKVVRDELMERYHEQYPQYNFGKHKGYPTAEHRDLLKRLGPCPIHRLTFRGVKELLAGQS